MKNTFKIAAFGICFFAITLNLNSKQDFPTKIPNGNKFSCNTCHTNGGGTPRNAFGLDVKKNLSGNNINWAALSKLDSDGDGFTNGVELQDPDGTWTPGSPQPGDISKVTNPGDKNSVPTTVENEYNRINKIISNLNIYPNPINNKFQISFDLKFDDIVSINIYNYEGKLIQTIYNGYLKEGFNLLNLNLNNNLFSGVYLIGIKTKNVLLFDKIVVE